MGQTADFESHRLSNTYFLRAEIRYFIDILAAARQVSTSQCLRKFF